VLVGRAGERAQIAGLLESARAGVGAALVLAGEPGVGKTALLEQATCDAADMTVLRCDGCESELELAFSGFADVVAGLEFGPEVLPEPQASILQAALALGPPIEAELFAIVASAHALIATAARLRPVLLVIDDAQWLDPTSQRTVLYVARRAHLHSLVVLIAVRDDEEAVVIRSAGLNELVVLGLPGPDADDLLVRLDSGLAPSVREQLAQGTRGNPLALIELVATLDDAQRTGLRPLPDPLPSGRSVERAYLRRLRSFSREVQDLLLLLSCSDTGDLVEVNAAARSIGLDPDCLGVAERTGLVLVEGNRAVFRHPQARSATYHSADTPSRRAAHRALAAVLGGGASSERAAWHAAAGAEQRDETVAAALEEAAVGVRHRVGHGAATDAFERAADLTPDPERRAGRLLEAAQDAQIAGRFADAERLIDTGIGLTADPRTRADLQLVRGRCLMWRAPANETFRLLVDEADRVEQIDPSRAARLLAEATGTRYMAGDQHVALAVARRAHQLGRSVGPPIEYVTAHRLAECLIAGGDPDGGWALCEPQLDRGNLVDTALRATGFALSPYFLAWLEEYGASRRVHDRLIELARQRGALFNLSFLLASRSAVHFQMGEWDAADRDASDAIAVGLDLKEPALHAFGLFQLVVLDAARGNRANVDERTPRLVQQVYDLNIYSLLCQIEAALGLLELGDGRADQAISHLVVGEALREGAGVGELKSTRGLPDLVEAYIRMGDRPRAADTLALLQDKADAANSVWAHAGAARCRGLLRTSGFEREFDEALELHAQHPSGFERARTQLCYGERLRRAGERAQSRRWLGFAFDTFTSLRADTWAKRAQAELRATGDLQRRRPSTLPSRELTTQELQIGRLVAAGASNREIAAALFLSTKTVEHHLSNAYRKRGVNSRTQLARIINDLPTILDSDEQ
jgi:DNA-binding CsgD family transcriptional regulator